MKLLMISTVQAFYRQRAGMFFVLLGFLFGFMNEGAHYGLALFFLTEGSGMYYLAAIWLLYTLLCAHFIRNLWTQPEYAFIYQARLWPGLVRIIRFLWMALGFLQPILYYGMYMVLIARQDGLLGRVWPLPVFYIALSTLLIAVADWRIRNPQLFNQKSKAVFRWPFPRPVSWIYWSIEWLVREKGFTFLCCKTGATCVFVGTLLYYQTDRYDIRLPAIGFSLGYLLNIGLSYELFRWENEVWLWNRSLPFSRVVRYARILLIHMLLLLPETLVAIRYHVIPLSEMIQLYGLGLAAVMVFQSYLYKRGGNLEDRLKPVLSGFVLLTLAILYKAPAWGLGGAGLIASYYMYAKWYGKNEVQL